MKKVTIQYDSVADDYGRRSFTAVWTTSEMVALSKTGCECSTCDYGKRPIAPERIAISHPAQRGQCFRAVPAEHIARWRRAGFKVTIKDPFKKEKV